MYVGKDLKRPSQILTDAEIESFKKRGVVRLEHFLPDELVKAGQQATYKVLERAGIRQNGDSAIYGSIKLIGHYKYSYYERTG